MKTPRNHKEYQISILLDGLKVCLKLTWGYLERAFCFLQKGGYQ